MNPIQNQGSCGSCYSFASIAALETYYYIKNKKLLKFSEQQVVSCSTSYGNHGCSGGNAIKVFSYTRDNGIMTNNDYPYATSSFYFDPNINSWYKSLVGDTTNCKY